MSRTTAPAFQIYPADILRSADLRKCTWATRGIWWDILCLMWFEEEQGKLCGTQEELCRVIGCQVKELEDFLSEAKKHKFADVTFRNGKIPLRNDHVTILNRRMHREYKIRSDSRLRQQKHRDKEGRYGKVTSTSIHPSSSSSLKKKKKTTQKSSSSSSSPSKSDTPLDLPPARRDADGKTPRQRWLEGLTDEEKRNALGS